MTRCDVLQIVTHALTRARLNGTSPAVEVTGAITGKIEELENSIAELVGEFGHVGDEEEG